MRFVIVIFLVIFFQFSEQKVSENVGYLIRDFIKSFPRPGKITVYGCWNKEMTGRFLKILQNATHSVMMETNRVVYGLQEHQTFFLDLSCPNSGRILKKAHELDLFRYPFKWILHGDGAVLGKFNLGVDSQVFLIGEDGQGGYLVKSVYKYNVEDADLVEETLTTWSPIGAFRPHPTIDLTKRTNLKGTRLKTSYVVTNLDTLNHLEDGRHRHIDAATKTNWAIIHTLLEFLNATGVFTMQRTWGHKNTTTGMYTGMLGDLQQNKADIGGTPLFVTPDRIVDIEYVAPTSETYFRFIFRAPPLSYVSNVFTLPFNRRVWHSSFVLVGIILVCLYVVVLWEWRELGFRYKLKDTHTTTLKPELFDAVMMEIGAITQQGADAEPRSVAGRIATIFTFISFMFLYTSYCANIVSLLQTTTDSIRSLDDLLSSRLKLGVENVTYAQHYFKTATDPVRKAIYEQKVAPKGKKTNFLLAHEGIKKVREGFYAFNIELTTGYKMISDTFEESEKCGLREIEYINVISPLLSVQKRTSFLKVFKVGLRKMHETGIQKREIHRIYTSKPTCHSGGTNFVSVGLIDCYSAFLIFAFGMGFAAVLLLLELVLMAQVNGCVKRNAVAAAPNVECQE